MNEREREKSKFSMDLYEQEDTDRITDTTLNYITSQPQERTELNKGEVRGLFIVKSIAKDMQWNLIDDICNEYYYHMRSYKRKGIREDIQILTHAQREQQREIILLEKPQDQDQQREKKKHWWE